MAIRKILVGIKHLEAKSLPPVLKAAQIARAFGAEIELFHALADPPAEEVPQVQQRFNLLARQKLDAIAERLRNHGIRTSIAVSWDYPEYEAIIRRALATGADLIVAQRYAGRHTAAALMRLTDWELVKLSPLPVLLVKSPRPYRHPSVLAAIDPGHRFDKPIELDKQILRLAGAFKLALRGTLHAVHAYDPVPLVAASDLTLTPQILGSFERQSRRAAAARFQRTLRTTRIARAHRYLIAARAIDGITEGARRSRSSIVVMGAVARSGLKRLVIGNTAERILDHLSCDVLVVKPPAFRNRVPRALRGARPPSVLPIAIA